MSIHKIQVERETKYVDGVLKTDQVQIYNGNLMYIDIKEVPELIILLQEALKNYKTS